MLSGAYSLRLAKSCVVETSLRDSNATSSCHVSRGLVLMSVGTAVVYTHVPSGYACSCLCVCGECDRGRWCACLCPVPLEIALYQSLALITATRIHWR